MSLRSLARDHLPAPLVAALRARARGLSFLLHPKPQERWRILGRFERISAAARCEHAESEAVLYAQLISALPESVQGDIVECGCFLGGSTAKLSILAKATGRKLTVFDSFQGLPSSSGHDEVTYTEMHTRSPVTFRRGDYRGTLAQVQATVNALGEPSVVRYVSGYFEDTLPGWDGTAAVVVIDVDLVDSTRTCLQYLWPRVSRGGVVLSQDCHLAEVISLIRDVKFWTSIGVEPPPTFIGLGREKVAYAFK